MTGTRLLPSSRKPGPRACGGVPNIAFKSKSIVALSLAETIIKREPLTTAGLPSS